MGENDRPSRDPVPTLMIGPVPIYGDTILSPMAGYSDVPFRSICREMGSAMSYVPCVLDDAVIQSTTKDTERLDFRPEERPVAIQMLGKQENRLVQACLQLMAREPDIIDLNLGCPARRVASRGRGAALLRDPVKIGRLVSRLVQVLPVPVTAKIRLGWDDLSRNYVEIARILEGNGVAAIAVHGRTRAQGYDGKADWQAIKEIKRVVSVPVLANGDVRTVTDIADIKAATGCDAVLIGRGAIGNPWIFGRRDLVDVPFRERLVMVRRHLETMVRYYGEGTGLLRFRKHVVRYLRHIEGASTLRRHLVTAETPEDLLLMLESWHPGHQIQSKVRSDRDTGI